MYFPTPFSIQLSLKSGLPIIIFFLLMTPESGSETLNEDLVSSDTQNLKINRIFAILKIDTFIQFCFKTKEQGCGSGSGSTISDSRIQDPDPQILTAGSKIRIHNFLTAGFKIQIHSRKRWFGSEFQLNKPNFEGKKIYKIPDPRSGSGSTIFESRIKDPDPLFLNKNQRIRIHIKMKWIHNPDKEYLGSSTSLIL